MLCAGPVYLLTNPISAGYVQNPISVYYCYDAGTGGALQACIAEVTNTPWGERVTFLFDHRGAVVPKALHVSPMMDMHNTWCVSCADALLLQRAQPCLRRWCAARKAAEGVRWAQRCSCNTATATEPPCRRTQAPQEWRPA